MTEPRPSPPASGPGATPGSTPGSTSTSTSTSTASVERTRLAWHRTALATSLVALLAVRVAVIDGISLGTGLAIAATAIGWVAAIWLVRRRTRILALGRPPGVGRTLPAIALLAAGFAGLGILLVAAGR